MKYMEKYNGKGVVGGRLLYSVDALPDNMTNVLFPRLARRA